MPLRVHCPTGHVLMVPDERAGRAVKCPRCQQVVMVPSASARFDGDSPPATSAAAKPEVTPPSAPSNTPPQNRQAAASSERTTTSPSAASTAPPASLKQQESKSSNLPAKENGAQRKPATSSSPTPSPKPPAPQNSPPQDRSAATPKNGPKDSRAALPATESPTSPAETKQTNPPASNLVPPPVAGEAEAGEVVQFPPSQIAGAFQLAGIILAVALFSMSPAAWETWDYLQAPDVPLKKWALVLVVLGLVQIGYAIFIAQIPDWTSAWVVSLASLALAGGYGALLGIAVMSAEESGLISLLQLNHEMADQKVTFWSIAMISATSLLSWYAGHMSAIWHRVETVVRQTGVAAE